MRLLRTLIDGNDTVWFYCKTKELARKFLSQCEEEGIWTLNNQKPTTLSARKFYGLFDDLTMGYLSNMIWCLTFHPGRDEHVRIDYEKYSIGAKDFICHKPIHLKKDYSVWDTIAYSNGLGHNKFYELCDSFIAGQSFEEYNAYVYRYLIESSWHYSSEQAVERMQWEDYYIAKCFLNGIPVADCAVEVGYGCG